MTLDLNDAVSNDAVSNDAVSNDAVSNDAVLAAHLARREDALARVRRLLVEHLKVPLAPEEIDPDAPLFGTGLGLDSVDAVELVVAIETHLGVRLPEGSVGGWAFRTVASLVELILEPPTEAPPKRTESTPLPPLSPDARALRTGVTIHVARPDGLLHALALRGEGARDALGWLVPSRLHLRDAQARQSLLLDVDGVPIADVVIAADDEDYLLLVDGLGRDALDAHVRSALATRALAPFTLEHLDAAHAIVSLHGPWAWELASQAISEDLLALPYLNFFRIDDRLVLRAGTTGEYGYHVLVPEGGRDALVARLLEVGRELGALEVDDAALSRAALEGWFFDARTSPRASARELGLGWRLARDREFFGRAALEGRAHPRRPLALVSEAPLAVGDAVSLRLADGTLLPVGEIVRAARSEAREAHVAMALVPREVAHGGIDRFVVGAGAVAASSVAPPFLDNRSLHVDPRRHTFRASDELVFGPLFSPGRARMEPGA